MNKKALCLCMALLIGCLQTAAASPIKEAELREKQEDTTTQLDDTYTKIDELQEQKKALDAEIDELDRNLVEVMVSLNVLKNDILSKENHISEAKQALSAAEEKRDAQYKKMKARIQQQYESSSNNNLIVQGLEADGISEMLSQSEYSEQMYKYDEELLEKYTAAVDHVTALNQQLEAEKAELEAMETAQQEQQAALEAAVTQKEGTSKDCADEIRKAEKQAKKYAALLEEQTAEIARLEEQRRQELEEAKRRAAQDAAIAAAQAEAFAASQAANGNLQTDQYGNVIDGSAVVSPQRPTYGYGTSLGQQVVDYALQFVGNRYVWGGTSLTDGADCSGFVQSIYKHFGVSLPRVSQDQMYAGREVSYAEAQPGDLICYGDHIAIYMGNGRIVHASNSAPYPAGGIKVSENAAYRTILAVRRVI